MSTTEAPRVRRGFHAALGALAVAGLAALVYVTVLQPLLADGQALGAPRDVAHTTPSPSPGDAPSPSPSPTGEVDGESGEPVDETFEVFTARDPFQQLVVPASSGGGGGGGGSSPSPNPGGTASPAPSPTSSDAVVGATTVRLVDVFTDDDGTEKILVTVNGTGYEVAEGETFAGRFRVLDITGDCATLLFGDSRFTLCKGEQIRK